MNTLKYFRKPYFSILFAYSVLLTSCSQTDSFSDKNASVKSLTNREVTQDDIKRINELEAIGLKDPERINNNFVSFQDWLKLNNWSVHYLGFNDDSVAQNVMKNSLSENIAFAKNSGVYSELEIAAIDKFYSKVTNAESQEIFADVLADFKSDIYKLTLSTEKIAFYDSFFTTFEILNKVHPEIYNYSSTIQNTNKCVAAAIGLALSYAALFTIEVGSFGSATVLTCVGFVWASATFGGGCKN